MLRHKLRQFPEISGGEHDTAQLFKAKLKTLKLDAFYSDLGGIGIAAIFSGEGAKGKLMFFDIYENYL